MSILLRIKQQRDHFSKTDQLIASFIEQNRESIKTLTSTEFAKQAGVGQSSVIKFIKKIGFLRFSDFKIALSEQLILEKTPNHRILHNDITKDDSLETIMHKVAYNHIHSIEDTLNNLLLTDSLGCLEQVISKINRAKKVIILGLGASSLVAKDLEHKLTKIGKMASHDFDPHVQATHAMSASSKDLILTISHSGETQIFIEILKQVQDTAVTTVSITGSSKNSIQSLSELNLYTIAKEQFMRSSALTSRIAQLTMIDIIFMELLKLNHSQGSKYIEKSTQIVGTLNKHLLS